MKQTDISKSLDKMIFQVVQDCNEIFFVLERKVDGTIFFPETK